MVNILFALTALASVTSATPFAVPAGHDWQAPGPNDVRGPCPGLNSLANHGFLPRSGKGLTIDILVAGGKAGLNVGKDFMTTIGRLGLKSSPNYPFTNSFDLNNIDKHNRPIEHDASLSRQDQYFGNWFVLNDAAFNQWQGAFGDAQSTTIQSASAAKFVRLQDSRARNPKLQYGFKQVLVSYAENALYLQTMGRNTTSGVADLDYVRYFFSNEQLPYALGWSPSPDEINIKTIGAMLRRLDNAEPNARPAGMPQITDNSYANLLAALDK